MKEKCPFCNTEIDLTDKFCPNCGKKLPDKDLPFSTARKLKICILSVLLAPFGLYWFFKYFRSENTDKRKVAFNVLYISIVMIIILFIINFYFVRALQTYVDSYNLDNFGY